MEDRYYVIVMWTRDDELDWLIQDYVCTYRSQIKAEVRLKELTEDPSSNIRYTLEHIIKPS